MFPLQLAAHNLHQEVKHWESADNELIQAAKQMALLMAKLSQLVRYVTLELSILSFSVMFLFMVN